MIEYATKAFLDLTKRELRLFALSDILHEALRPPRRSIGIAHQFTLQIDGALLPAGPENTESKTVGAAQRELLRTLFDRCFVVGMDERKKLFLRAIELRHFKSEHPTNFRGPEQPARRIVEFPVPHISQFLSKGEQRTTLAQSPLRTLIETRVEKQDAGVEQDAKTNGRHQHSVAPIRRNGIVEVTAQPVQNKESQQPDGGN